MVVATVLLTANSIHTTKSLALLKDSPKELLDEAWQIVNRDYVDSTFNHNNWMVVRQEYLKRSYSSRQQVYQAIQEMLGKLGDPYTNFLAPQEVKNLANDVSGDFVGVGIAVGLDERTREWIVVEPIAGTPAALAGILPEDVILKINGQSTSQIDTQTASKYLVGPLGSHVIITIRRRNKELKFNLIRDRIELHPVSYQQRKIPSGKIGYIRLPEFTSNSPKTMRRAIQDLEKKQVKGYILDLRSNPGGLLDASVDIARMWLKQGTIVEIANRQSEKERFTALQNRALSNKPLVVLVDGNSASASEILAGALQENNRAALIGTKTFGKGLVQTLESLKDGSAVKITIAKYYTPKGRDINKVGIAPNVVVPLTEAEQAALVQARAVGTSADPQYAKAVTELRKLIH